MNQPGSLANWRALDAQLGPDCLRVASYNLHGCVGRDGARDAERIAEVIAELGCDTVGLQEVFGLEALERRLNMTAVAGPHHMWHDRHVGNQPQRRDLTRSTRRPPSSRRWVTTDHR